MAAKEYVIGRSLSLQEAFVREAGYLRDLRHANVVQLKGVSVAGDRGIVLLEYCEGARAASPGVQGRQPGALSLLLLEHCGIE